MCRAEGEGLLEDDHYEVLGIRPSASLIEIELAYKGRRSQYHPDRYTEVDKDSVAWATAKMQAVNKAYSVLKDPEQRERFDRSRAGSRPWAEPEPEVRRPDPEPTGQRSLRQALEGLDFRSGPLERVFVAPHIPRKKLMGALDSYGGRAARAGRARSYRRHGLRGRTRGDLDHRKPDPEQGQVRRGRRSFAQPRDAHRCPWDAHSDRWAPVHRTERP